MARSLSQIHESGCLFGKALNKRRLNRVVVIQRPPAQRVNPPLKTSVDLACRAKGTAACRESRTHLTFPSPSAGLRGCRRFQSSAVNYSTMLLEAESGRLYVGARGVAFALNASDISTGGGRAVSSLRADAVGVGFEGPVVRHISSPNF